MDAMSSERERTAAIASADAVPRPDTLACASNTAPEQPKIHKFIGYLRNYQSLKSRSGACISTELPVADRWRLEGADSMGTGKKVFGHSFSAALMSERA